MTPPQQPLKIATLLLDPKIGIRLFLPLHPGASNNICVRTTLQILIQHIDAVAEMRPMQFMRVVGIIWSVLGREVDVPVRMFAEDVQAVQLME
jgi:hypothetical protein